MIGKFYEIDNNLCTNKGLARLERTILSEMLVRHPAYLNFVLTYKETKTTNDSQIKSKERIYAQFKGNLREAIIKDPENKSKILLQICNSCNENPTCQNYQNYINPTKEDDSVSVD